MVAHLSALSHTSNQWPYQIVPVLLGVLDRHFYAYSNSDCFYLLVKVKVLHASETVCA